MQLKVDVDSGVPIYLQIAEQIRQIAGAGGVRPGDRLPSVRSLALKLRVNPNTVQAAYRHLEAEGTVDTRQGLGVFLSDTVSRMPHRERVQAMGVILDQVVLKAHQLDLPPEELLRILKEKLDAFEQKGQAGETKGGQRR